MPGEFAELADKQFAAKFIPYEGGFAPSMDPPNAVMGIHFTVNTYNPGSNNNHVNNNAGFNNNNYTDPTLKGTVTTLIPFTATREDGTPIVFPIGTLCEIHVYGPDYEIHFNEPEPVPMAMPHLPPAEGGARKHKKQTHTRKQSRKSRKSTRRSKRTRRAHRK